MTTKAEAWPLSEKEQELAREFVAKFGMWGDHPVHHKVAWRKRVREGLTLLGYWEWVVRRVIDDNRGR